MFHKILNKILKQMFVLVGPCFGLILVLSTFAIWEFLITSSSFDRVFLSQGNITTVIIQTVIVALCALGMTLVIISGGIDLSVGSMVALASVATALALRQGFAPVVAVLAALIVGALAGFLNGALVTGFRLMPFIATLGTLGALRGLAKWVASDQKIDASPYWLTELMARNPQPEWLLIAPGVWILGFGFLVVVTLLYGTRFGRHVFAIGGNEQAARLSGVPVERVKLAVYTISGSFVGIAGLLQFARLSVGDPTVAVGVELDVIAAVVIGGASLSGGRGSVLGAIIGALIMSFLRNGCTMVELSNSIQEILIGCIIIAAVALDQLRRHSSSVSP